VGCGCRVLASPSGSPRFGDLTAMPWGTWAQAPPCSRSPPPRRCHALETDQRTALSLTNPNGQNFRPEPPRCWLRDVSGSFLNMIFFLLNGAGWCRLVPKPDVPIGSEHTRMLFGAGPSQPQPRGALLSLHLSEFQLVANAGQTKCAPSAPTASVIVHRLCILLSRSSSLVSVSCCQFMEGKV